MATGHAPARATVVDPDNLNVVYVGTDVGVWKGVRTSLTWAWTIHSDGLPEAAVVKLRGSNERTRLLRAGTHGRGMWEITLDAASNPDPDIYMRCNYADTGRIVGGGRYPWLDGVPDPTAPGWNLYHWMSADIKVRRPNLALPVWSPQQDYFDFAVNIGDGTATTIHVETADLPGTTDAYFVEVQHCGITALPGSSVTVLLLFTNASAGLAALPSGYAAQIVANNPSPAWLGPSWFFADPVTPYRTLSGELERADPGSRPVRRGSDHGGAAAGPGPRARGRVHHDARGGFLLTSVQTSIDDVSTMTDKHVVHRNLHLVASTATPIVHGGFDLSAVTFLIDFHNVSDKRDAVDIGFHHVDQLARLSVVMPKQSLGNARFDGFGTPAATAAGREGAPDRRASSRALERARRRARLRRPARRGAEAPRYRAARRGRKDGLAHHRGGDRAAAGVCEAGRPVPIRHHPAPRGRHDRRRKHLRARRDAPAATSEVR